MRPCRSDQPLLQTPASRTWAQRSTRQVHAAPLAARRPYDYGLISPSPSTQGFRIFPTFLLVLENLVDDAVLFGLMRTHVEVALDVLGQLVAVACPCS